MTINMKGESSATDAGKTREAIKAAIHRINRNPFLIRTERDMVSMLYCELVQRFPELYETAVVINGKKQKTTRIHREYYFGNRSGKRIDLVVLDEKAIRTIWKPSLRITKDQILKRARFSDAIEVKVELGGGGSKRKEMAMKDIKRLSELKKAKACKRPHFVYILRWPTKNRRSQRDVKRLVQYLKNQCKRSGIRFYLNKYMGIFQER